MTHLRCIGVGRFRRRRDVHRSKDFLAQRVAGRHHRQMRLLLPAHPYSLLLLLSVFGLHLQFSSVRTWLFSQRLSLCRVSFVWLLLPLTLLWGKWHFLLVLLSAFFCSSVLGRGDEGDGGRRGGGGGGNGGGGRWVGRRLTVWVFLRLSTSSSSPSLLLSSAASTCLVRQSFLY